MKLALALEGVAVVALAVVVLAWLWVPAWIVPAAAVAAVTTVVAECFTYRRALRASKPSSSDVPEGG
jgi:hypothetical protein